ncbi:hypothetical protein M413DRAFT_350929 [Hebeloma cylindrosporum]|uniref:Uncharacterized protein n=1 Tax=Hebeloma cylindrosporum TaxID=76867 RepID=A0A0C2XBG1_HEBCY|nr:hypothetical protein M413DRAFT_350929 [Hebeloma cylindrosporum h7]
MEPGWVWAKWRNGCGSTFGSTLYANGMGHSTICLTVDPGSQWMDEPGEDEMNSGSLSSRSSEQMLETRQVILGTRPTLDLMEAGSSKRKRKPSRQKGDEWRKIIERTRRTLGSEEDEGLQS